MSENNILATILAGGKSTRFGTDKSLAKLGKKTLLEHTILKINKNFSEILIVSNNKSLKIKDKNINIIEDCMPGQLGPLAGVLSAMKWIEENNKNYKWLATFPCDTPFFDNKIFDELKIKSRSKDKKLYFFKSNGKRHNIFGLWSLELKKTLEEDLRQNHRKVETWANKIGLETIEIKIEKKESFFNINTKEDLEKAKYNLKDL